MFILEKPYVSKLLEETLLKNNFPVLKNQSVDDFGLSSAINYWSEEFAVEKLKNQKDRLVYTNSENSINWIVNNLGFTELPQKIDLFKNKVKCRQLLSSIYPDFYFKEVDFQDLDKINVDELKFPFIIKPSVGFLSMGVYPVKNSAEWVAAVSSIKSDIEKFKGLYPLEVMDSSKFIIEEIIEGDEFAIDIYYDKDGEPVVLNIFQHPFVSEKDVSDRVYMTSKKIIKNNLERFEKLLSEIGKLAQLKSFPMHIEVRANNDKIVPIEINPMRFAGWCTTDLVYFAYGINPYEYFMNQQKPDWSKILSSKGDEIYFEVIADVPSNIDRKTIKSIDYDEFLKNIKNPLDVRKVDYRKHPLFCLIIARTSDYQEIKNMLELDFSRYISYTDLKK